MLMNREKNVMIEKEELFRAIDTCIETRIAELKSRIAEIQLSPLKNIFFTDTRLKEDVKACKMAKEILKDTIETVYKKGA